MLKNMKRDKRTDNKLEESLPSIFWDQSRCWIWAVSNSIMLSSFEFSEWSFKQALGYATLWILIYKMSNFNSLYNPICTSDRVSNET